jgi:hypothetical protein
MQSSAHERACGDAGSNVGTERARSARRAHLAFLAVTTETLLGMDTP